MPSIDEIERQRRELQAAESRARDEARQRAIAEHMADPLLLPRADSAEAEISTLERAAGKATESVAQLEQRSDVAARAGDETGLVKLEPQLSARRKIRDVAVDAHREACSRHEMLRVAARIFRECQQLDSEYPGLEGRGRNVDELANRLTTHVSAVRETTLELVLLLAEAVREHNAAGASFDARAELAGYGKRVGRVSIERVLAEVADGLRDRNHQFNGKNLGLGLHTTGNRGASLTFSFSEPLEEIQP